MGDAAEPMSSNRLDWLVQVKDYFSSPVVPSVFAVVIFSVLQAHRHDYPDPDAVFHIAVAKTYLTSGWLTEFRWMHSTWLAEHFVDPYWLAHWATVPFVILLPDPLHALRLVEVLISAATVVCLGYVLKQFGARASYGWALLVVASTPIALMRLGALRGSAAFTPLWIYFILVASRPWPRLTFLLAWLAVYTYTGFPLLPITTVSFALAAALTNRQLVWKPTAAAVLGIGTGLLVNPYWPHHLRFYREDLFDSIFQTGLVPGVNFGAEWSSLSAFDFVRFAAVPFMLLTFTALVCSVQGKRLNTEAIYGWILSAILLLMSARSVKFLDFAGIAAWVAFALTWPNVRLSTSLRNCVLGVVLACACLLNLRTTRDYLKALPQLQPSVKEYAALADALKREVAESEPVVIPWDDFPFLYLLNPTNSYPVGLNLNYLRRTDEKRFAAYGYLYSGAFSDPDEVVSRFFDSKWLVTRARPRNSGEQQFLAMLGRYPKMRRVFANDAFALFRRVDGAVGNPGATPLGISAPRNLSNIPAPPSTVLPGVAPPSGFSTSPPLNLHPELPPNHPANLPAR